MSNLISSKALLKRYLIARIPFISVHTTEQARTLTILKEIADELTLPFYVHTLFKGIYDLSTDKIISDDRSIYSATSYMGEQMRRRRNLTLVLTEAPDLSDHNADAKEILNLVTLANEAGGTIVILTNNPVWGQLKRLGMTVRVDPPDEDEMYFIIKAFIDDYRGEITIEWDDADIRSRIHLAGVTQIEAENLIATLIANKRIQKSDLDQLRMQKMDCSKTSPA